MAAHSVYRKAGRRALGLFQVRVPSSPEAMLADVDAQALCVVHLFNEHVAEVQMVCLTICSTSAIAHRALSVHGGVDVPDSGPLGRLCLAQQVAPQA